MTFLVVALNTQAKTAKLATPTLQLCSAQLYFNCTPRQSTKSNFLLGGRELEGGSC